MCKLPNETGLYWARKDCSEGYTYVINVTGKSPFLTYTSWDLRWPDRDNGNNLVGMTLMVSDEINTDICCESIIQITKPGLYLLSGRITTLAFVTGVSPYMSCYTWDVEKDIKEKNESAWLLPFARYIENPKVNK